MDAPKPTRIIQQKPEQIIERLHRHITPSLLQLKAQLQQAGQVVRQQCNWPGANSISGQP